MIKKSERQRKSSLLKASVRSLSAMTCAQSNQFMIDSGAGQATKIHLYSASKDMKKDWSLDR